MSGTPEIPAWLREAAASTQHVSEAMRRTIAVQIDPGAIANIARVVEQYQVVSPSLQQTIASIQANRQVIESIQQLWRRYAPDNWHDLQLDEPAIVDFVEQSGIPIVWVPRAAIIEAMVASDARTRYEVLVASTDDVLEDLETVLDQARGVDIDGHTDACEFAGEAIAAACDGHWTGAQTLAASGVGQVIHGMFGYPVLGGLGAARKKFRERDIEESTMMVLKAALLEVCTVKTLTDIPRADLEGFNRHGTQHGDRRFFSQANALGGLLLLAGWIREFAWLNENGLLKADE